MHSAKPSARLRTKNLTQTQPHFRVQHPCSFQETHCTPPLYALLSQVIRLPSNPTRSGSKCSLRSEASVAESRICAAVAREDTPAGETAGVS